MRNFKPKTYSENALISYTIEDTNSDCLKYIALLDYENTFLEKKDYDNFDYSIFIDLKNENKPKIIRTIHKFDEISPLLNLYTSYLDKQSKSREGWWKIVNERYEDILLKMKQ